MIKELLKNSFILTGLSLLAGFFHYLFQILAAKRLPIEELGTLNVQLNYFSLVLTLGIVAQYWPVLNDQSRKIKIRAWILSAIVFLLSACFIVWKIILGQGFSGSPEFQLRLILLLGIFPTIALNYWTGVFQKEQLFLIVGLGGLCVGIVKLVGATYALDPSAFALSVVGSTIVTLIVLLLIARMNRKVFRSSAIARQGTKNIRRDLTLSFLTALGFVLFPAYDLINISHFIDHEAAGRFSQIQLFSRMLYFAPIALLQVCLPQHVRYFHGQVSHSDHKRIRSFEFFGLFLCYGVSILFGFIGPSAASMFLGIEGLSGLEIFLACASITPLYGLLSSLQLFAASRSVLKCLFLVLIVFLSPLGAYLLGIDELRQYLFFSTMVNTVFGVTGFIIAEKLLLRVRKSAEKD